ncbi:hypothetical protein Vretifemale_10044 [Volvox reticuliferus]|uniref:Serine-threonine/tyrosine-protein kinase catalytic domain-containing protein n=1 Tax=Volvox reticuliferus TaxID=1737510 RepID=A0A8J4CL74_9CHLO|nr:hypothetical protein Vretifemale_10044 [Volvox reticuliferus]
MAPEVYRNMPYNEKVDVFSLGVLMYEVFSRTLLLVAAVWHEDGGLGVGINAGPCVRHMLALPLNIATQFSFNSPSPEIAYSLPVTFLPAPPLLFFSPPLCPLNGAAQYEGVKAQGNGHARGEQGTTGGLTPCQIRKSASPSSISAPDTEDPESPLHVFCI